MSTDISEAGLEATVVEQMTEPSAGWIEGDPSGYDPAFGVHLPELAAFLEATQPEVAEAADLHNDGPTRLKFLTRLQGEITKDGVVEVLRNGFGHLADDVTLFYGPASAGNVESAERHAANRFVVVRQLHFSSANPGLSADLGLFINGIPVATMELKNSLTGQTFDHAIKQYEQDRDPNELIFGFGRALAHFAVDDNEVRFCTELKGEKSWFLPLNRGYKGGPGNPPNPDGIKTDYLWREVLARDSLTEIITDYAALLEEKNPKTGKVSRRQIFPRYHQLDAVRKLLADAEASGPGERYLIQHSAGSGKSNSIAWLSHGLVNLRRDGAAAFDTIIVLTDRILLDKQIQATIKAFSQVGATVGNPRDSNSLARMLAEGKKIIISTVQMFPHVIKGIGTEHAGRNFALIIDEAHSSQGGETSRDVSQALAGEQTEAKEGETDEDRINRVVEARRMPTNASYFAFTATPKAKTLEIFGEKDPGSGKFAPFHVYSMKQAIGEKFILDVLAHYTTIDSYYRLEQTVEDDPMFDSRKASRKLRAYVEGHEKAISQKAEIIVEHFHDHVLAQKRIGGEARAMVVCSSIERALQYYYAIRSALAERGSSVEAIVAFSGEHEYKGEKRTEAKVNGFRSGQIAEKITEDPYRLLVCADKFQTGYDEPLLHTMYVDKTLGGVQAVQTLSRLNRAHPDKETAFVLDFANEADDIQAAFSDFYKTTILSEETDANQLHDLRDDLFAAGVFGNAEVIEVATKFLDGAERKTLDFTLDSCVAKFNERLRDEEGAVFKKKAKAFTRIYGFLGAILPYPTAEWEQLSIFLNLLTPKLPVPEEEDLSRGILEAVNMETYRAEMRERMAISLDDSDGELDPVVDGGSAGKPEPELDPLSIIVQTFNDLYSHLEPAEQEQAAEETAEVAMAVADDPAYKNMIGSGDRQNARIEHGQALNRVMLAKMGENMELYKRYQDDPEFKRQLTDISFEATYRPERGDDSRLPG